MHPASSSLVLLLLLCCCCVPLCVVLGQQLFVSPQSTLDDTRGFSLCAITPTHPLTHDGSGEAVSLVGSPRNCFDAQSTRHSHSISHAVYAANGCVINATGFATCSSIDWFQESPWQVVDMLMGVVGAPPTCALFANGTVTCTGSDPTGAFGYPAVSMEFGTFIGWQPTPLAYVNGTSDPPVTVVQMARAPAAAPVDFPASTCFLLSNHTIRCAVTDPRVASLVTDAPQFDGRIPVQMCTGNGANACVLYRDGAIVCW